MSLTPEETVTSLVLCITMTEAAITIVKIAEVLIKKTQTKFLVYLH